MIRLEKRWYQEAAIESIFQYVQQKPHGSPLIALPTGVGKSVIIGEFIRQVMTKAPRTRVMMATHVKELIEQNSAKLLHIWPLAPLGIYSAGLNMRDMGMPISFVGVQSVYKKAEVFGWIDILVIDECFSADTEILTETGFVRFDKLGLQRVAQYSANTKEISFCTPSRYIRQMPSSKMVSVESENNFSLLLTEDHEMLVKEHNGQWSKRKAKDVVKAPYSRMTTGGYAIGPEITLEPWERFAIAFQADGSLHRKNVNGSCIAAFSFSKQRKIDAFLKLMQDGDFKFNEVSGKSSKNENVKARRRFMVYLAGGVIDKDITPYFQLSALSSDKCKAIIEYMNIWDGHVVNENNYLYTNTNKQIADFYQAVACMAGYKTKLSIVKDNRKETFNDCYRLSILKDSPEITTQTWNISESNYNGEVYCVEVPAGCIIVRRNGKVLVTGNCHLLAPGDASMYQTLIGKLRAINPSLIIIGLTATAYRMGQGMLTDGDGIFSDICFDMTDIKGFNRLVSEGFLCPLYPKSTEAKLDVSKVGINNGEFNKGELEKAVDTDKLTRACLTEICYFGADRECWMIFAAGISHAEHIAKMLREEFNVSAAAIHSKNSNAQNDEFIEAFKSGHMRCAVNMNKLTTGFDHAPIDLIAHMRPTLSTGLWVQMNGRGTRPSIHTGKRDCLALDFARNTQRLGPINDPKIPKKKGAGGGDAPVRICPQCNVYNPASARFCFCCNYEFTFQQKLVTTSSTEELIRSDAPVIETFPVKRVLYGLHQKKVTNPDGTISYKSPCMKVTYLVGITPYYEWVHLDAGGLAGHKSREWWRQRHAYDPPTPANCAPFPSATQAALSVASQLKIPKHIRVWVNRPMPEIMSVEY